MTVSPASAKAEMRQRVRAAVQALAPELRAAESARLRERLERESAWAGAGGILFFAPLADEPDVWPLVARALAAGKLVALPRFDPSRGGYEAVRVGDPAKDLRPGRYGIREPAEHCPVAPPNRLDLALAPGVAFDLDGYRLGRGGGYYDRLLAGHAGAAWGVAFDQQVVARIPAEPHDARMSCIVTPTRCHHVTGSRVVLK